MEHIFNIKIFAVEVENYVEQAFAEAKDLWEWTNKECYKNLAVGELSQQMLEDAGKLNEQYELQLVKDVRSNIPRDCFMDIVLKPTYATLALFIYAWNHYPELFTPSMLATFEGLGKVVLRTKLLDHGYEAESGKLDNLLLLAKSGLAQFIENHPAQCSELANFLKNELDSLNVDEHIVRGFGLLNKTVMARQILAAATGKTKVVFVYGTLMRGQRAESKLSQASFLGTGCLPGYTCYDLGSYPGIKCDADGKTYGELYAVDQETIDFLDGYESEGYLYSRIPVEVNADGEKVQAQAYEYIPNAGGYKVEGRWNCGEYVWYACYGSNLSIERFMKYINDDRCHDHTPPAESYQTVYRGRMYFANKSGRWDNCGVAFYDSSAEGEVYFRLYKITRSQLQDVHRQEGKGDAWYNRLEFMGYGRDGYPVYTITSKERKQSNVPCKRYLELIENALVDEIGLERTDAMAYLEESKR